MDKSGRRSKNIIDLRENALIPRTIQRIDNMRYDRWPGPGAVPKDFTPTKPFNDYMKALREQASKAGRKLGGKK